MLKKIIDKYGVVRVRHAVIVFGTTPKTAVSFGDVSDPESLKRLLTIIPRQRGDVDLSKALEEARRLFQTASKRPNARKVLVVIMDSGSVSSPGDIGKVAKRLEEDEITVVPVVVGQKADPRELGKTTTNNEYLVKTPKDENPATLAETIIDKSLKGTILFVYLFICFSLALKVNFSMASTIVTENN